MENDDTHTQEEHQIFYNDGQKTGLKESDSSKGGASLEKLEGLGQGVQGSQYMQSKVSELESPDADASKVVISFQDVPLTGNSIHISPPQTSQMMHGSRYDLGDNRTSQFGNNYDRANAETRALLDVE